MAIELKLTFVAPFPTSVQITSLAAAQGGAVPAGLTFPITMTGPDGTGTFFTAPLVIPTGITYTVGYTSTLNGVPSSTTVLLTLPPPAPAGPPPIAQAIAINATGPKTVTADGQTVTQQSIQDQIAADRYAASNAAMRRPGLPFKLIRFIRPGAAGYDRGLGGSNRFYDDPNWR